MYYFPSQAVKSNRPFSTHLSGSSAPPTSKHICLSLAQPDAEGRQGEVMIKNGSVEGQEDNGGGKTCFDLVLPYQSVPLL